jgi:hypothetical protein
MTTHISNQNIQEYFEYHGSTTIERTRKTGGCTLLHDWILFNSVQEAQEYFYNECSV